MFKNAFRLAWRYAVRIYTVLLLPHGTHARFDVDLLFRTIFGFYYLPILLYTILVGTNVGLQFVYVSVIPTVQNLPQLHYISAASDIISSSGSSSNNPTSSSSSSSSLSATPTTSSITYATRRLLSELRLSSSSPPTSNSTAVDLFISHGLFWVSEIFTALLPHATLFFCVMAFFHKVVSSAAEGAVDTVSHYRGCDYPLLFAFLKVALITPRRRALTVAVMLSVFYLLWRFASDFIFHAISTRPASVLAAVAANILWCSAYLISTLFTAWQEERRRNNNNSNTSTTNTAAGSVSSRARNLFNALVEAHLEPSESARDNHVDAHDGGGDDEVDDYDVHEYDDHLDNNNHRSPIGSSGGGGAAEDLDATVRSLGLTHRSQSEELASFFVASSSSKMIKTPLWVLNWWRGHVNSVRHLSMMQLLMFAFFWVVSDGPIIAFRYSIECLIALNIPNFWMFLTVKIVLAIIRMYNSFHWLLRHRRQHWMPVVALLAAPYLLLVVYTATLVSSTPLPLATLGWAAGMIVARCILLCREHAVSEEGGTIAWYTSLPSSSASSVMMGATMMMSASATMTSAPAAPAAAAAASSSFNTTARRAGGGATTTAPALRRRRIAPGLAALLENARECGTDSSMETISLEIEADLKQMKMLKRGTVYNLIREEQPADDDHDDVEENVGKKNNNSKTSSSSDSEPEKEGSTNKAVEAAKKKAFTVLTRYALLAPRLILFQSSASFSGSRFQIARTVVRTLTHTLLVLFILLVCMLVAQESMELLRPLPLRLRCLTTQNSNNTNSSNKNNSTAVCSHLEVDHLVTRLQLQLRDDENDNDNPTTATTTTTTTTTTSQQDTNATSGDDENEQGDAGGPLCSAEALPGVHMWELAWLSLVPYLDSQADVKTLLKTINAALQTDWAIEPFRHHHHHHHHHHKKAQQQEQEHEEYVGTSRRARMPWRAFIRFQSKSRNTSVISVRGTDMTSALDALQDVDMYLESVVFHILSNVVPGLAMLPRAIVSDLIRMSADVWPHDGTCLDRACERDFAAQQERKYVDILLRYLEEEKEEQCASPQQQQKPSGNNNNSRRVIFTGHSIGGAIAHVAAARSRPVGDRSVGFASPGIALPITKFKVPSSDIVRKIATTIVTESDIVPHIGGQLGQLLHSACHDDMKERCHSMESIVDSMWHNCASIRTRFSKVKKVRLN